jgi:hypothetical protein
MGKVGTGILMLLTFGGIGIWTLIDLIYSILGKFHDNDGLPIDTGSTRGLAPVIVAVVLFYLLWFGLGIYISTILPPH